MDAYHRATDEEQQAAGVCEEYDLLLGPNGFECFLGEPEDRTWRRDGKNVVKEMNKLHAALAQARADCAALVWEHRGKCVSDESAKALMEVIRGGTP